MAEEAILRTAEAAFSRVQLLQDSEDPLVLTGAQIQSDSEGGCGTLNLASLNTHGRILYLNILGMDALWKMRAHCT